MLNRELPVRLRAATPIQFELTLQYMLIQSPMDGLWSVGISGYIFSFGGQDGSEVLAYHWHPGGTSRVTWPHMRIHHDVAGLILPRTHLPTGVITVQDVVRLAVEEFGVQPRRPDWLDVLERTRQSLEG